MVEEGPIQGCQLPIELAPVLEEQVGHLLQEVYEKVVGELLETEIQPLTRVWLEVVVELSLQLKAGHCCEQEEGEGQSGMAWTVLLWVERPDEQVERKDEQVERKGERVERRFEKVVEADGALKELRKVQWRLYLGEVVGEVGEEQRWEE